jgi:hypothetical protein
LDLQHQWASDFVSGSMVDEGFGTMGEGLHSNERLGPLSRMPFLSPCQKL